MNSDHKSNTDRSGIAYWIYKSRAASWPALFMDCSVLKCCAAYCTKWRTITWWYTVKHENCGRLCLRLSTCNSRPTSQQCKLSLLMVCQVNITDMNRRLNTSDPLDITVVCSTPTSTVIPTTIVRPDVVTPTSMNAVPATDHSRSTSRSVADRPTTSAAGDATSQQVTIVWDFVTHNSTIETVELGR